MASSSNRNRKRGTSQPPRGTTDHPLAWTFTGLFLGLAVAAGVYVYFQTPHRLFARRQPAPRHSHQATPAHKRASRHGASPTPEPVPGSNAERAKRGRHGQTSQYLVQVAAFRKYAPANAEKARLALIGLESKIDKEHKQGGRVWYRVRIGPESHAKVKAILKRLNTYHYKGIVMPAPG